MLLCLEYIKRCVCALYIECVWMCVRVCVNLCSVLGYFLPGGGYCVVSTLLCFLLSWCCYLMICWYLFGPPPRGVIVHSTAYRWVLSANCTRIPEPTKSRDRWSFCTATNGNIYRKLFDGNEMRYAWPSKTNLPSIWSEVSGRSPPPATVQCTWHRDT